MSTSEIVANISSRLDSILAPENVNAAEILEMLKTLQKLPVDLAILQQSTIARSVNTFRKLTKDKSVASLCKSLCKTWKEILDKSGVVSNISTPSTLSPSESPAKSQKTDSSIIHYSHSAGDLKLNGSAHRALSSPALPATTTHPVSPAVRTPSLILKIPAKKPTAQSNGTTEILPADPDSIATIESRSSSPSVVPVDSGSSRDGVLDNNNDSNPPATLSAVPARLLVRTEKVRSHNELLAEFRKDNPAAVAVLPALDGCDESLSTSSAFVIGQHAKTDRKRKRSDRPSTSYSLPVSSEPPVEKNYPPGRGPDPVDAEIASVMSSLPSGFVDRPAAVESLDSGSETWTRPVSKETRSGDKVVLLPYIYFPFPAD